MKELILVGLIIAFLLIALIYYTSESMKQSKKDWETLYDLQKRAYNISTKEELEIFHKEFVEKANKIHNELIRPQLMHIAGFLKGLYKQFKK